MLFFSDTPGLLADKDDESTLIRRSTRPTRAPWPRPRGRMVVKVEAALKAIDGGVGQVIFSDAAPEASVQRALAGEGTRISMPGTSR